ncbi:MAG: hypothetical protein UX47_C0006G0007 [Candidatus Collierbacteria bacterium GW2011_GWA2_46_26]|uniref:Uncharacterized protein n=1 Tax=Candidatus Collierbacteria bacterium GW2011_GWA2_46_26 TaxID=1618381 RepID=A0A0G1PJW0_9BACT|nr:MAG: hypothetical protein UX47_C0006G0007 [Candidatus Collierbacteria bacterium GW2011_GWA2_46_26]
MQVDPISSLYMVRHEADHLIKPEQQTPAAAEKCLGFLRVCTHDADASILFLGNLFRVPGQFDFFRMVPQPEHPDSGVGSTFIIGGDAEFIRNCRFLQTGGLTIHIETDNHIFD